MPTVATRQPAKAKPAKTNTFTFEEGEELVYQHRPPREKTTAAISSIRKIMKNKPSGDIVESLRAFRENPRG